MQPTGMGGGRGKPCCWAAPWLTRLAGLLAGFLHVRGAGGAGEPPRWNHPRYNRNSQPRASGPDQACAFHHTGPIMSATCSGGGV